MRQALFFILTTVGLLAAVGWAGTSQEAGSPSVKPRQDEIQSTRLRKKVYGQERTRPLLRSPGEEGGELVTEPLTGGFGPAPTAEPTATPESFPANAQIIRNYSVRQAGSASPAAPGSMPPVLEEEEVPLEPGPEEAELKTEPLFAGREAVSNQVRAFRAELDRAQIHLDESFTLAVDIIVPDLRPLGPFELPALPEFDLINSYQSDVITTAEQKVWKVRSSKYVYLARQPGVYTIPPIRAIYQGRRYQTQPLALEVEGARSGFGYRQGFKPGRRNRVVPTAPDLVENRGEEEAFAAALSAYRVYVNQQVNLKIHLRFTADRETAMKYTPPVLDGFLSEPLPQTNREENISGGTQRYVEHNYHTALFPMLAGNLSVSAAQVRFYARGKERVKLTEPLALTVVSLPEDPAARPAEAGSRLVGRFRMSAELESQAAEVNAPIHLSVRLAGQGNIREAPDPVIEKAGAYRIYLEDRREKISLEKQWVEGERTYRYLVVFDKPGTANLGQAGVRYFDPERGVWMSAACVIPAVRVKPRAEMNRSPLADDQNPGWQAPALRPNHGGAPRLRLAQAGVLRAPWFWLLQLLGPLAVAAVRLGQWYRQRAERDLPAVRTRRAYSQFRKSMRRLRPHIHQGEIQEFYTLLTKAIAEYLGAKFNAPVAYIGAERLPEFLAQHQVPEPIGARLKVALMACEYVRYAAVSLPARDMRALHHDLQQAVKAFESWWEGPRGHRRPPETTAAGLLLLLWAAGWGAGQAMAGERELNFWRGNDFAEKGEYASAEAEYRKVIAEQVSDPDVYYNLGNVYLRQGKLGPAILAYERGLQLAPRDADLHFNLAQAAARVKAPVLVSTRPKRSRVWPAAYRWFTAEELAQAASACYFGAILLWLWMMLRPGPPSGRRRAAWVLAALALGLALWSAARVWEPRWQKRAVVLAQKADVHLRPYPRADVLFSIHEGTRVSIKAEEEVWLEITLPAGSRGWVERSLLGIID